MKTLATFLLIFITASMPFMVQAKDIVIALSPYQSPDSAELQLKSVLSLFTALDAGDKVTLIDGIALKTIGTLNVPTEKKYQSPKARLVKNRQSVARIAQFYKAVSVTDEATLNTVKLPQLLRHVAQHYGDDHRLDIVVLSVPFYHDPKQPLISMHDAIVPSDGHLKAPRAQSVFSATDKDVFNNLRVHLGFGNEQIFAHDMHRYYVERFWSLFISEQGGSLVTFTADQDLLFDRVQRNVKAPENPHSLGKENTLEMIKLLGVVINPDQSIFDKPLAAQTLSPAQMTNADHVEIGVSWDCACDLDIYAKAFEGATTLSYRQKSSPEGLHLKDLMSATKQSNAFETVRFHIPIDLTQLNLAVHVFSDQTPNTIHGEIRIAVGQQVYGKNFNMTPTGSNNPNRDAIFAEQHHPFVTVFDPIAILGAE